MRFSPNALSQSLLQNTIIINDRAATELRIGIQARSIAPPAPPQLSDTILDFGAVASGDCKTESVTLNGGNTSFTIDTAWVSGANGLNDSRYQIIRPTHLYYTYARPLGLDVSVGSRQPHNLYLQILAERGLLGLSAFAIVMYVTFRNLYFSRRAFLNKNLSDLAGMTSSIGMALVIYLFASLFLHDSFIRYFWTLIGVAWSIPQLAHDENEINEETTPSLSS